MTTRNRVSLYALGLLFIAAGANHFVNTAFYLAMMPPYLPWHYELVMLSGILEIIAGLGVFAMRFRRAAGLFMILIMIGVFPANLHMALNPVAFPDAPVWLLYVRLPLQGVLIWWAWVATRVEE
jgi:uncharacterized membrane protein